VLIGCSLWDIECGACLRVLEGHEELVRCIRFDNKRIVSGAYDGCVTSYYQITVYLVTVYRYLITVYLITVYLIPFSSLLYTSKLHYVV